jgi:glycosyltransferase involved in cell wall biosynthesis
MPEFFASKFKTGPDHVGARLLGRLEQASIRFADAAVTVTEPMRQQFIGRGAPPEKITVVLNGADETVFDPDRYPPRPADGEFHLVCHGSIEERYGIDTVIRAVALLRDELPGLRFQVFGRGTYKPELERLATELGVSDRVSFSDGYVAIDELIRAIAEADVGVVAMKQDAFRDLTIATKMYDFIAMRKPQLMSRTRSVEAYFDDAAFAWFDSDDPHDLARAIRLIERDPDGRTRMVEAAALQAEDHRWPVNAARYVSVVEGAARR